MQPDTLLPAPVTADAARRALAGLYGIDAGVAPLPGEYDNNFRVTPAAGPGMVLKIMHPSRDPALVDLQVRALLHVAARAPQLPLPRVHASRTGQAISVLEFAPGVPQAVWAVGYIPGRPFAAARPKSLPLLTALGEFLGSLTAALADFDHPAAARDLKWDLERAQWIDAHVGSIADAERRRIVAAAMAEFAATVVPALPSLRRSVIHGDANDYNVLTDTAPAAAPHIAGVIDFGDMHRGLQAPSSPVKPFSKLYRRGRVAVGRAIYYCQIAGISDKAP